MITHLANQMVTPRALTDRQREAQTLVASYAQVALEPPSLGWLARRMGISRQRAWDIRDSIRRKGAWPLDRA